MSREKRTIYFFIVDFITLFVVFILFYPKLLNKELNKETLLEIFVICLGTSIVGAWYFNKFILKK